MNQIIRELKRQAVGEKLAPEQPKGLIRAGYVYWNGDRAENGDRAGDGDAATRCQRAAPVMRCRRLRR
jgi:hypothetical protein